MAGCCTGESVVWGLGEADGDVLAAGASRLPGSGEDNVLRPMVMRYTSDLVRLWKGRSSDRVGRFLDAAEVGDAVYAVGETDGTGLFLIDIRALAIATRRRPKARRHVQRPGRHARNRG